MKTILESIRENLHLNECYGDEIFIPGHCGPGRWVSRDEWYRKKYRENKAEAEKIDKDIVKEYKKLQTQYKRIANSYYDSNTKAYELTNEFGKKKNAAMGIENVINDLIVLIHQKRGMYMSGTITLDVLKVIAHIISEEMDESGTKDDQMAQALKNIKEML